MSGVTARSPGTRALEIHAIPGNPVMLGTSESLESLVTLVNHGSSVIPDPLILPVPIARATFLTDEDKITLGNHLDLMDQRAAAKVSGSGLGMLRAAEAKTMAA
jgi:seryl-tRNA synthetase